MARSVLKSRRREEHAMKSIRPLVLAGALAAIPFATPRPAQACGGFFCNQVPVDQTGEQILFSLTRTTSRSTSRFPM
jgi:hypothetical protein